MAARAFLCFQSGFLAAPRRAAPVGLCSGLQRELLRKSRRGRLGPLLFSFTLFRQSTALALSGQASNQPTKRPTVIQFARQPVSPAVSQNRWVQRQVEGAAIYREAVQRTKRSCRNVAQQHKKISYGMKKKEAF